MLFCFLLLEYHIIVSVNGQCKTYVPCCYTLNDPINLELAYCGCSECNVSEEWFLVLDASPENLECTPCHVRSPQPGKPPQSSPGFKNGINWILKCCDFIKKWSLTASQTETTYYENISVSRWHQNVALLASFNQENVRPPCENCASRKNQRARNTNPQLIYLPQQNMDYKFEWKDKSLMFSK